MKRIFFLLTFSLPRFVLAQPEQHLQIAEIEKSRQEVGSLFPSTQPLNITVQALQKNPRLTHRLLGQALYGQHADLIENVLRIYRTFPDNDPILVTFAQGRIALLRQNYTQAIEHYRKILAENPHLNPVRVELAIALFADKQNVAAEAQFHKAQAEPNLPERVNQQINAYLDALKQRNEWQVGFSASYVRDENVNNVANNRQIENTNYLKNDDMMPQVAHGVALNLDIGKDFNLMGRHYLALRSDFFGKIYWDSHIYDDLTSRTILGYRYKTVSSTVSILPFYERRWYGGSRYRKQVGGRIEFSHQLTPNWQISTALEGGKNRYVDAMDLQGSNRLASATLLWIRNPKQFFSFGADFNRESTKVKQYSSDTLAFRLGWGQEWNKSISSRVSFSMSQRRYKDTAILGGILPLGKTRRDKLFSFYFTLWKRDWQIAGVTPKLQFHYRKQLSNLPTMYRYSTKNINVIVEKTF